MDGAKGFTWGFEECQSRDPRVQVGVKKCDSVEFASLKNTTVQLRFVSRSSTV